jgi:hypothetical protein
MPFFAQSSLLAVDRDARTPHRRKLFNSLHRRDGKKLVVSDSTLQRVLRWMDEKQSREGLWRLARRFHRLGLLERRLSPSGPAYRLAQVDGSILGTFPAVCLSLLGEVNLPLLIEPMDTKGKELPVAQTLIRTAVAQLKDRAPELWLLDGLYFNAPIFSLICKELGSHLLIKCKDAEFRDVLKDASQYLLHPSSHTDPPRQDKGRDPERQCSWTLQTTSGQFAGIPLSISLLEEQYSKRSGNQTVRTWIVTTLLSLRGAELREAAHLRWQIENNVFKRLSHLVGSKRFWFKKPRPFFTLLRLTAAAVAAFDAFLSILRNCPRVFQRVMRGAKFTWKTFFSQLQYAFSVRVLQEVLALN